MVDTRTQVLYIMGAGRSGSTLVGIALGNLPELFFGGELFAWHHFGGEPITGDDELRLYWADLAKGISPEDRFSDCDFYRDIEHWRSLIRPWRRRGLRDKYARHNSVLFRRISDFTSAALVVDSSHYPLRAAELARNPSIDLKLVHLVRDPRDVVNAFQNPEQRHGGPLHPVLANLYCWVVAAASGLVFAWLKPNQRVLLRYEDFLDDPRETVRRICDFAGVPYANIDPANLVTGPLFQGNRIRHSLSINIAKQPHRDLLGTRWRRFTAVAQWPLLAAYGYSR